MTTRFVLNLIHTTEVAPKKNPKGAGRKPKSTPNPIAHIIDQLSLEKPRWFDDILFGSCLTAAGQSSNVCNVEMNAVLGALHLKSFEVESVKANGVEKRKAERIIKAARHAAHGVHHYLLTHPALLARYEALSTIEARLAYKPVALVHLAPSSPVPQHITVLYKQGDYHAYGEALRAFRLGIPSGDADVLRAEAA